MTSPRQSPSDSVQLDDRHSQNIKHQGEYMNMSNTDKTEIQDKLVHISDQEVQDHSRAQTDLNRATLGSDKLDSHGTTLDSHSLDIHTLDPQRNTLDLNTLDLHTLDSHVLATHDPSPSLDSNNAQSLDSPNISHESTYRVHTNESNGDSDDEYIMSDDEDLTALYGEHFPVLLNEHATFLLNSLAHAMDSLELDKSLVLQAQLSGQLNNENQKIVEKRQQLVSQLHLLKEQYEENFVRDPRTGRSKVEVMQNDLKSLEKRLYRLKHGTRKPSLFGGSSVRGMASEFPVEYNQARDKILERQLE